VAHARDWALSEGRQAPEGLPNWKVMSAEERNQMMFDLQTLEEQEEEMKRKGE
jgi:predicted Fe-S protein YdhL (DUF1289 family)